MKRSGRCPKCDSTNILADAKAVDRGDGNAAGELEIGVEKRPHALIFTGLTTTTVSAWMCRACGFVELYADDPEKPTRA